MADDTIKELWESLSNFGADEPSSHLILVSVKKCIDIGKLRELVDALTLPDYEDVLQFVGWELIGVICPTFVDNIQQEGFQECKRLLKFIAEKCNGKEVCIGVLEQLNSQSSFHLEKFITLLNMVKTALQKLKEKKLKCVSMVLPSIMRQIKSVELLDEPTENEPDDEEGRIIHVIQSVLEHMNDFLRPLVQECTTKTSCSAMHSPDSYITSLRQEILQCLIQLLDYPLVFLDLGREAWETKESDINDCQSSHPVDDLSPFRIYPCEIMQFIQMAGDSNVLVYLMEYTWKMEQMFGEEMTALNGSLTIDSGSLEREDVEEQDSNFPILGLGCFSYLLLVEEIEKDHFPAVHSFKYMVRVNMKHVLCLLRRTELYVIHKGLELLNVLFARLEDKCLEYRHDEFKHMVDILKTLINVMTICSSKKLRLKSVHLFPILVAKLDQRSQYGIFYTILEECHHAGVAGMLIYLLKEQVNHELCSTVEKSWFQGTRLMSILQLVLKPPPKPGTEKDLVQDTDRIMGTLNLVRFILLRDLSDKTNVWENFTAMEQNFLEPLKETLKETTLQYQAELMRKKDEMAENKSNTKKDGIEFNIKSPDGKSLPPMPYSAQIEALESGLHSLDMMESILARISEIAKLRKKEEK
ncbi:glomulin-like isoform X1 [Acropora palmata]|uniref:glomulin-like isoform X1 n=1 Tax=Acropora palmata TaxID=6131 RepID=UPI003D9FC3D5